MENASDTFSYHVEGLSAFTPYAFRVLVSHMHGQTASSWATLLTAEDSKYTCQHLHNDRDCTSCFMYSSLISWTFADFKVKEDFICTESSLILAPRDSVTLSPWQGAQIFGWSCWRSFQTGRRRQRCPHQMKCCDRVRFAYRKVCVCEWPSQCHCGLIAVIESY